MYQLMLENQAGFTVTAMCRVLQVCRRAFYQWRAKQSSARRVEDEHLTQRIRTVHADSGGRDGVRRVAAQLRHEWPGQGLRRVTRLMRACGLADRTWRRKVFTTRSGDAFAPADLGCVEISIGRSRTSGGWRTRPTFG